MCMGKIFAEGCEKRKPPENFGPMGHLWMLKFSCTAVLTTLNPHNCTNGAFGLGIPEEKRVRQQRRSMAAGSNPQEW